MSKLRKYRRFPKQVQLPTFTATSLQIQKKPKFKVQNWKSESHKNYKLFHDLLKVTSDTQYSRLNTMQVYIQKRTNKNNFTLTQISSKKMSL